jgi:hypothetical protein
MAVKRGRGGACEDKKRAAELVVVLAWLERAHRHRHGITAAVAELRSAMAANALWRVRAASRAREEAESELGRGFGLRCPKRHEEKAGARVMGADARLPCMEDASTKYQTPGV